MTLDDLKPLLLILALFLCLFLVHKKLDYMLAESKIPPAQKSPEEKFMKVKVYSYQLKESQTDSIPGEGAFGDQLIVDNNSVAISRDLLKHFDKYDTIHLIMGARKLNLVVMDKMGGGHRKSLDILTTENITGHGKIKL